MASPFERLRNWWKARKQKKAGLWQTLEEDLRGPHLESNQSGNDSNLWEVLQLDLILNQAPEKRPGIEFKELIDKNGNYYMLKNGITHSYIRLMPEEIWIWQKLDGQTTVQDLIIAYSEEFGKLISDIAFASLLDRLRNAYMLDESPQTLYHDLSDAIEKKKFSRGVTWLARIFITREFTIKGLDSHLEHIHAGVGKHLFNPLTQIILLLISTIGMYYFVELVRDPKYHLLESGHVVRLGILIYLPLVIHEFGHAITAKHFKCEVYRGGFMLYYGLPAVFVDTTDIQMFGKREKLAVTWAGPYTGYIIAGLCALLVRFMPGLTPSMSEKLLQLALTATTISTFNLLPMVKLDGYYLVADALEIPRLRERSMEFLTSMLSIKFRERQKNWTGEERIFLAFGVFSFLSTFYFTWAGLVFWDRQVSQSITKLFNGNENVLINIGNAGLAIIAISSLAYLLFWVFSEIRKIISWLEGKGFLSNPGLSAFIIILVVLFLILFSRFVLQQSMQGVFIAGSIIAFPLIIGLSWNNFRNMKGSVYRWIWLTTLLSWTASTGIFILELSNRIATLNLKWVVLPTFLEAEWKTRAQLATIILMFLIFIGTVYQLLSFKGGWRAFSLFIISASIVIYMISFSHLLVFDIPYWLMNINEPARLALRASASGLMLGGLIHWRIRPNKTEFWKSEFKNKSPRLSASTREKITNTFDWFYNVILGEIGLDFGTSIQNKVKNGIFIPHTSMENVDFSTESANMTLGEIGRSAATKLDELLENVERVGGRIYAHRILASGYDVLNWETQEIAEDYILKYMLHARGLNSKLFKMVDDLEVLLRSIPLFMNLKPRRLKKLSKKFQSSHFARNEEIVRVREIGMTFYVIRTGRVEVMTPSGKLLTWLGRGDYFGETALLTNEKHNATFRALTPVETLDLDRKQFKRYLQKQFRFDGPARDELQHLALLREIPIFDQFDARQLISIVKILKQVTFEQNATIFRQGEAGDSFYIIESGTVRVEIDGSVRTMLEAGEYFGEIALVTESPRTATLIAQQNLVLLRLSSSDFQKLIQSFDSHGIERIKSRRILLDKKWDNQATIPNSADL